MFVLFSSIALSLTYYCCVSYEIWIVPMESLQTICIIDVPGI